MGNGDWFGGTVVLQTKDDDCLYWVGRIVCGNKIDLFLGRTELTS